MAGKKKPWSGRFQKATAKNVEEFTSSIHYDKRLYPFDIEGSIAHAKMLAEQSIISKSEASKIISALKAILKDIEKRKINFYPDDEDIHMAIERELIKRIGEIGGKLHAARSRNDQIVLDVRLFLREEIDQILLILSGLQSELIKLAKKEIKTIMPGYTHLQKAQPVLLSHYFLAFREMFARDSERLKDCKSRFNVSPLGAAAGAQPARATGCLQPVRLPWPERSRVPWRERGDSHVDRPALDPKSRERKRAVAADAQ